MATTAILEAFIDHLDTFGAVPPLPIAWPGRDFNPPESGMWLEARIFPNEPLDPVWDNNGCVLAIGFAQVMVGFRPRIGQLEASRMADALSVHFAKGTVLGPVRVSKAPYQAPVLVDSAKLLIPVTIQYRGFVNPATGGYALVQGENVVVLS